MRGDLMGLINVTVTAKTSRGVTVVLTSDGHNVRSLGFVLGKMLAEAEEATIPQILRSARQPVESAQEV